MMWRDVVSSIFTIFVFLFGFISVKMLEYK